MGTEKWLAQECTCGRLVHGYWQRRICTQSLCCDRPSGYDGYYLCSTSERCRREERFLFLVAGSNTLRLSSTDSLDKLNLRRQLDHVWAPGSRWRVEFCIRRHWCSCICALVLTLSRTDISSKPLQCQDTHIPLHLRALSNMPRISVHSQTWYAIRMEPRILERKLSIPGERAESRRSRMPLHLLEYHLRSSSISCGRSTHGRDCGMVITGTIGPPGLRT